MYALFLKPISDRCFALILLIALSPLMVGVMILLAIFQRGQIFFIQQRIGLNGQKFKLIKFRTMRNETMTENMPVQRVTFIGKILRRTSVDELPQLVNVLVGNMSFIGPRPLLVEYLPLYNDEQRKRHSVRPGITGLAQVNGRHSISWEDKFRYDVEYAEKVTLRRDLTIAWRTIILLFSFKPDVSLKEERFSGNP